MILKHIGNLERIIEIKSEANMEDLIRKAAVELDKAENAYRALIEQQKTEPMPFDEYEEKSKSAAAAYDNARSEYDSIMDEAKHLTQNTYSIRLFIENLKAQEGVVKEYDFDLMKRTVDQITVYHDGRAEFEFMNGVKITVTI